MTYDQAEYVHQSIPHSVLVLFEQGGHGLVAESRVIRKQIADFLNQLSGTDPWN